MFFFCKIESIHKHSGWNKWIRDQIPEIFMEATKNDPVLKNSFFNFIPSVNDVPDPFWQHAVKLIRRFITVSENFPIQSISLMVCK